MFGLCLYESSISLKPSNEHMSDVFSCELARNYHGYLIKIIFSFNTDVNCFGELVATDIMECVIRTML